MGHKSPAKICRTAKRITKFLERKPPILTMTILPTIDILPVFRKLSIVSVQTTHVLSQPQPKPNLDYSKTIVISFTLDQHQHDETFPSYSDFMKFLEKQEPMNTSQAKLYSTNFRHK